MLCNLAACGAWGPVWSWASGSLSDASWAESGDLPLRETPAEISSQPGLDLQGWELSLGTSLFLTRTEKNIWWRFTGVSLSDHDLTSRTKALTGKFSSNLTPPPPFLEKGNWGVLGVLRHLLARPSVNLSLFQTLAFCYCLVSLCFRQWTCVFITLYIILFFSVDRNCILLNFLQSFYHCLSSPCFIIFFEWMSDFVVVLSTEGWMAIIYAGL